MARGSIQHVAVIAAELKLGEDGWKLENERASQGDSKGMSAIRYECDGG